MGIEQSNLITKSHLICLNLTMIYLRCLERYNGVKITSKAIDRSQTSLGVGSTRAGGGKGRRGGRREGTAAAVEIGRSGC